jgi:alkylation response protein AidB-like acyl-CoA dehydrogenase
VRNLLADRYVECEVARLMAYNVAWMQGEGLVPNKEASMSKAFGSETLHRSANSVLEVAGLQGALARGEKRAPLKGRLPENWMISFSHKIAGGTSEVQRGIVAGRGLGLPRG